MSDHKLCAFCGKEFYRDKSASRAHWDARRYCSRQCCGLHHRAISGSGDTKICAGCGVVLTRKFCDRNWNARRYCSQICAAKAHGRARSAAAALRKATEGPKVKAVKVEPESYCAYYAYVGTPEQCATAQAAGKLCCSECGRHV